MGWCAMPMVAERLNIDPEDLRRGIRDVARRNQQLEPSLDELESMALVQLGRDETQVTEEEIEDLRGLAAEMLPMWQQAGGTGQLAFGFPRELVALFQRVTYIGEGGFGRVYKAYSNQRKMEVAVKVLKDPDDRVARRLFTREQEIWRGLSHRNIAEFFDSDIAPIYIEMEFVGGGSLNELAKPMPVEAACELALRISEGLLHAHRQDRMHGDVKPSNVLLTDAGEPKLSDWGLGRVLSHVPTATSASMTRQFALPYAAPEHFDRGVPLDFKTDVYQLGVLLFELVTGDVPFTADDREELREMVTGHRPPRPSEMRDVGSSVDELVLPCLEKSKGDRPELVDIRHRLGRFLGQSYSRTIDESSASGDTRRYVIVCAEIATVYARVDDHAACVQYLEEVERSLGAKDAEDLTVEVTDMARAVAMHGSEGVNLSDLVERFEGLERRIKLM